MELIFQLDWLSFFIVGLGTMFLIGELLVNSRGLFSILGFALMILYFSAYLDPSMLIIMGAIYFVGIILIFVDGQFINDGTLAVIGGICMIVSVGFSSPNWVVGLYAVIGVFIGAVSSLWWLKVLPKRNMWTKIALLDQLTEERGYTTMNSSYKGLIGCEGTTLTDMRPVGTIRVNELEYSAVTNGQWIKKGTTIIVRKVDGTRILVDELTDSKKA